MKADKKIPKLIYEKVGNETVVIENPEYQKHVQNLKYNYFLKASGIPPEYYDLDFKDYHGNQSKDSLTYCKIYAQQCTNPKFEKVSLYLWSDQNTSQKTMVCCAIAKEFLRQGLSVQFVLAGELNSLLQKTSGFNNDEDSKRRLAKIKKANLICIDDAWDAKKSILWKNNPELIIAEWDTFVRGARGQGCKFAMTSNLSPAQVGETYGRSLYEFLFRNFKILEFQDTVKTLKKSQIDSVFDEYL